ncbi:MAG: DUF2520 domain-containing protein [Tannerella sp.]|jgi:predicted short-subunit dehydrogenase-like oxidoreductase (DUF2520 family)|nr:DUF2520 domain-containing protein [Tannerella sp.]
MRIVLLGAGNVATHLSFALQQAGHSIMQIYSRSEDSAAALASALNTCWTTEIKCLSAVADLYFFSLKDDALPAAVSQLAPNNGIWVHTSGSIPMSIFNNYANRYGVVYPLQTFSKARKTDFSQAPCFVEANCKSTETVLYETAGQLSKQVYLLNSERRKYLHLAAVFACNFTNHMYVLAGRILEKEAIPMAVLFPLIDETAAKIHTLSPDEAQTGPAVRYDQSVIEKHLNLLSTSEMREIYQLISKNIHKESVHE